MGPTNTADDIQGLLSFIRDFINHPRRLDPILKDKSGWNMLASALDVVSDTEWAIASYEQGEYADYGTLYLVIYGLLQAMYVQQDALENMVHALERSKQYEIYNEPEAKRIREVRNDAIGHPTKRRGRPGEQISLAIVQHSLRKEGFSLLRASNLAELQFIDHDTNALIAENRSLAVRVLTRTKKNLEDIEMDHRRSFKDEKLAGFFPPQMGYYFEKIHSAIHSPNAGNRLMGEFGLKQIRDAFVAFKSALARRGVLNQTSYIGYDLDEVEYPLTELGRYLEGADSLTDPRAAAIFAHFARVKMAELLNIATEIDSEYEDSIGSAPEGV